jgi:hypothetical protein
MTDNMRDVLVIIMGAIIGLSWCLLFRRKIERLSYGLFSAFGSSAQKRTSLCDSCQHRKKSREAVAEYVQLRRRYGVVNDIAPKVECKRHEGYGHEAESLSKCSMFLPIEEVN